MRWLACVLAALPLFAGTANLTYVRSFPHSSPEYLSVSVDRTGDLQYKEAENDELPVKAHLSADTVAQLFSLAEQLQRFKMPVESGLKVANTGKKTFRYTDEAGQVTEAVFNYSLIPAAQQLQDRFEQIASTERAFGDLDRTMRFDKLGVNDSLAQIETLWLRKQLAAPDQFVPLLQRIASHESYMHLARERAARLKDAFTAPPSDTSPAASK